MSSLKEEGDLFCMLTHQDTQSGIFDDFFNLLCVLCLRVTAGFQYHLYSCTHRSDIHSAEEKVIRTPVHVCAITLREAVCVRA